MMKTPQEILDKTIAEWNPVAIICAYSGGYDSLVCTHLVHKLNIPQNIPLMVYSIDTKLSADGWVDFVKIIANGFGWNHHVYDNQAGFDEYVKWVKAAGCPYSLEGHKRAYNRLKDRAFSAILKLHKGDDIHNKVLFVSGVRKYESKEREKLENPINRRGSTNAIFCNPLFYWTDDEVFEYRMEHELPENPFYNTVGGSGDCQCNWGRFIPLRRLKKHSPNLASGNVAMVDKISRELHGYGWDGMPEGQTELPFLADEDDGIISPFLCTNCSRRKSPGWQAIQEERYLQKGFEL